MGSGIEKRATPMHRGFVRGENRAPQKTPHRPARSRDCGIDPEYLLLPKFPRQTSSHRRFQPRGVVRPRPGMREICKAQRTRTRRAPLPSPEQPRRAAPSLREARFPVARSASAGSARRPRVASLHRSHKSKLRVRPRPRAGSAPALRLPTCARPVAENPSVHAGGPVRQNLEWCWQGSSGHAMNNAFVLQDVARFAEVIANVRLLSDPVDVTRDAFVEIDRWFVTCGSRQRGVACEVTHFAGAKFAVDLRRNVDLQNVGKLFRDFANRCAASAANVYG